MGGFANRNTLWGHVLVDELERAGVDAAVLAPGSRSTPLTVAFARHPDIETFSHLDERSAAFFALGRARRTGRPTPVVTTSGTALANLHPAVVEADAARVPLLLLTADRPRALQDSGANQTIDQEKLYGDGVRVYRTLPDPAADARTLRSLRTALDRAVARATGDGGPAGPVHLNVPFEKPLEPTPVEGDVPDDWLAANGAVVGGRDGPWVRVTAGRRTLPAHRRARLLEAIETADRGLIVTGPESRLDPDALLGLARATGFPVLADPLSGHRYGPITDRTLVCGGYDSFLDGFDAAPDLVIRFGASPTSKTLRHYLRDSGARQLVVDPAAGWREATFTATDLVVADETQLATTLAGRVENREPGAWHDRFADAEARHWATLDADDAWFEGRVLDLVVREAPDPVTLFVSNSMPVRDLDRFGRPSAASITALGNRGASGIDGILSTGLGAGSATDDPLVIVTGDLAFYHDTNGLLACSRFDLDATVVLIDNDGGGIFHRLPIEDHDPPFTEFFRTPHGLEFAPVGELYDLTFVWADDPETFRDAYAASVGSEGTQVITVPFDAERSHGHRDRLHRSLHDG